VETVLESFEKKHGDLAKGVSVTLAESLRRDVITRMRAYIEEPEHRFFLALLMSVPARADIFALILERFPDQSPVDTILGWAEELIEPTDFGLAILDAFFPETLDVAIQHQGELLIAALRHALEGNADGERLPDELVEVSAVLNASSLGVLFD
jgi:hypothetical protein